MIHDTFEQLRTEFNADCEQTLLKKGELYAGTVDRLENFKKNAERIGLTPLQVWSIYCNKHLDAIFNFIKSGKEGPEGILENFKDARNYLDLGVALIRELRLSADPLCQYTVHNPSFIVNKPANDTAEQEILF